MHCPPALLDVATLISTHGQWYCAIPHVRGRRVHRSLSVNCVHCAVFRLPILRAQGCRNKRSWSRWVAVLPSWINPKNCAKSSRPSTEGAGASSRGMIYVRCGVRCSACNAVCLVLCIKAMGCDLLLTNVVLEIHGLLWKPPLQVCLAQRLGNASLTAQWRAWAKRGGG